MAALYWQGFLSGLTNGSIYAMIGLGFVLIFRATNVLNIAQGEFAMIGGLLAASLASASPLPILLCFALAILITGFVGSLFERVLIRPVLHQPFFVQVMITVMAIWVFHGIALALWGRNPYSLPHLLGREPLRVAGAMVAPQTLIILASMVLVVVAFRVFLKQTMFGWALQACSENKPMARMMGINVERYVGLSFFLSAALGALGGILVTPLITMSFYTGTNLMIKAATATVIGGLSSYWGPIIGGLLLGVLETWSSIAIHGLLKDAIALGVLIVVLLVRPQGILGRNR